MKYFFLIALSLIAFTSFSQHHPLDTRSVYKCGFSSQANAEHGSVVERVQNSITNPDEMPCDGATYQGADGSWCYSITYACYPPPLSKEQNKNEKTYSLRMSLSLNPLDLIKKE